MHQRISKPLFFSLLTLVLIASACSEPAMPVPTDTPKPTSSITSTPTRTKVPTSTPKPSATPNISATQHMNELHVEAQKYVDAGYLTTADGRFLEFDDFQKDWAQLGWYRRWHLGQSAKDFYITSHFKWSSGYRNADLSGCGYAFAIQSDKENQDHYAVFLDRSKVYFVDTGYYYRAFGPTRGTGVVKFDNPFDQPVEADFALIVKGTSAYVLVNDELIGEYTLSKTKAVRGDIGLTLLSGTNKDFGTRCEMTNIHVWLPWGG